jgi:hypothetical protein
LEGLTVSKSSFENIHEVPGTAWRRYQGATIVAITSNEASTPDSADRLGIALTQHLKRLVISSNEKFHRMARDLGYSIELVATAARIELAVGCGGKSPRGRRAIRKSAARLTHHGDT